ncbi:MAG: hypothetical protein PUJ22_06910 [Mitsuokella jalaludinii]|nr:hypothetical protein [Mitsuokella jalaludinii]MDD7745848.1 hypothetical protein [Mitsuokella jalaludinii]
MGIRCFPSCCFIGICLFQIGHRVLPFAGFFVNRFLQIRICFTDFSFGSKCRVGIGLAVHISHICLISQLGVCVRLAVYISRICLIGQLVVCVRLAVHVSRICLIGQLGVCVRLAVHISRICFGIYSRLKFRISSFTSRCFFIDIALQGCIGRGTISCFRCIGGFTGSCFFCVGSFANTSFFCVGGFTGSRFCGQASLRGKGIICTIFGVHRLLRLVRIRDRHGGVRGPSVVIVDRCEQHGGYGCSCGGCPQAGMRCFRVGFGVLRHDDVAVLCLAPNDFENPVHKMTSPFELLMIR